MNESIIQAAIKSADPMTAELAFKEMDAELVLLADPCDKAALLLRKTALFGILHRFVDGRREIARALETAPPGDPDITFLSERLDALFYHEEQNPNEAFKRMTNLLVKYRQHLNVPELRPIYEDIQQRRGFESVQLHKFEQAVPIFKECLTFEMTPEDRGEVLADLGICYSHLDRFEEARDCFLQAREVGLMARSQGAAHLQLGIVYYHLNLFGQSKREIQLCAQESAQHTFPMKRVYGWLSAVCKRLGEKDEAESYARLANPS
jgi:tetratricopeptide (TPR) repeat protein